MKISYDLNKIITKYRSELRGFEQSIDTPFKFIILDFPNLFNRRNKRNYIYTDNYFSKENGVIGFVEIRWLNLETFDYHPTEYTFIKDYGK